MLLSVSLLELVIGADTSNNGEWLGVIMGSKQLLISLYNECLRTLTRNRIHMSKLRYSEKINIIEVFRRYKSRGAHYFCKKVDIFRIIRDIRKLTRASGKKVRNKVFTGVAKLILKEFNLIFGSSNYLEVHLDREFIGTEKIFKKVLGADVIVIEGFAAELADVIAYINFRGISL